MFMDQWTCLRFVFASPARTRHARQLAGAGRRVGRGGIFDDRQKTADENFADSLYLCRLFHRRDWTADHYVRGWRKADGLSTAHVCLDFVTGARAAIDRAFDVQLGSGAPARVFRRHHDSGRTDRLGDSGVFHFAGSSIHRNSYRRSVDFVWDIFVNPEINVVASDGRVAAKRRIETERSNLHGMRGDCFGRVSIRRKNTAYSTTALATTWNQSTTKLPNHETMKLPSHLYLDERNIPYEARTFPPETEKGAANVARVLGFPERQAVKTLIFQVDTGERVLVMLGGDQNAVSGNLKKAIGSRNIQMAAPDVVQETTGYVIGSIPPFCWPPDGCRSFLEASLMNEPILGVGAGEWGNEIMITPQNLVRASKAIVVNLTERDKSVIRSEER